MAVATSTAIAIGAAVLSASLGSYAAISSAQAQESAANYNKKVAENDALARQQQQQVEAARSRDRSRRVIAAQRTAMAKSGGSMSGSNIDVLYDTSLQASQDIQAINYRGTIEANRSLSAAGLYGLTAANASAAGTMGAVGSIVGGIASGSSIYADYRAKLPKLGGG